MASKGDDCWGGRVRHPATHAEFVTLQHPEHGKDTVGPGPVCLDHKTPLENWEMDGWEVVGRRYKKL